MPITPVEIRNVKLKKKMRGYDPSDVDTILNEVAVEMERLIDLNNNLQRQLLSAEDRLKQFQNLEKSLKDALVTAQQAAEEKRKAADKNSELQIRETELACNELKQKAQKDVESMKFELASLKMQKVRFTAEIKSLIDAHQKLLDEKAHSSDSADVASNVEMIQSGARD